MEGVKISKREGKRREEGTYTCIAHIPPPHTHTHTLTHILTQEQM